MAIKANLTIDQGSDFSATVDVLDTNGQIFDLTGYSTRAQMRKSYASGLTAQFIASHNDAGGIVTLSLPSSDTIVDGSVTQVGTNSISPGRYLYDVEMESSNGVVTRVVQGTVTVTGGITR